MHSKIIVETFMSAGQEISMKNNKQLLLLLMHMYTHTHVHTHTHTNIHQGSHGITTTTI